jgi:hypothetical protein
MFNIIITLIKTIRIGKMPLNPGKSVPGTYHWRTENWMGPEPF